MQQAQAKKLAAAGAKDKSRWVDAIKTEASVMPTVYDT
jgi:hypothetical protein